MTNRSTYTATLELTSVDDLFKAPDISPFDDRYRDHSRIPALEFVADEIYSNGSYRSAEVTFVCPDSDEHTPEAVRAAVRRWASAHARSHGHDATAMRWRGLRSLVLGVIGFVVFFGVAQSIDGSGDDLWATVKGGFEVLAWIVVWFPLDTVIFSQWQHRLDQRCYEAVRDMDVRFTERVV